jgi:hypothetical protein
MNRPRRPRGFLASTEGLKKLKRKKFEKGYRYEDIRKKANVSIDQVKRLFNPHWRYRIGVEAIELIAGVLDLQPEEIFSFAEENTKIKGQSNAKNLDSSNQTLTPESLQNAITNNPQISQTIQLICIDTSNFIDLDNPAAEIYAEMVAQGCPERTAGEPTTMQVLKVYWKLLKSDKRVVLVFYQGMSLQSQQLSDRFLNDLSKFDGSICIISNQIIEQVTLKCFTPSQSIDDVLLWLA